MNSLAELRMCATLILAHPMLAYAQDELARRAAHVRYTYTSPSYASLCLRWTRSPSCACACGAAHRRSVARIVGVHSRSVARPARDGYTDSSADSTNYTRYVADSFDPAAFSSTDKQRARRALRRGPLPQQLTLTPTPTLTPTLTLTLTLTPTLTLTLTLPQPQPYP